MRSTRMLMVVVTTLVLCWAGPAAWAADKYFLQIPGVPGESTDDKHKDWIEVLSFSQDITTSTTSTGGARSADRPNVGPLVIIKPMDKAMAVLSNDCCTGKHYPQVVLEAAKPSGSKQVFFKYVLSDAVVKSIKVLTNDNGVLQQEVQLGFGKIQWYYTPSDGAPVQGGWDVTNNRAL